MFDPYGKTNAVRVTNTPDGLAAPHTLKQFYAVGETLILGPDVIEVQHNPGNYGKYEFYRMARIVLRETNKRLASWTVYRQEEEWDIATEEEYSGYVLRHSAWNLEEELTTQAWRYEIGPKVITATIYLNDQQCRSIAEHGQAVDRILTEGIAFQSREELGDPPWDEISILRSFYWGLIDNTWSYTCGNMKCEDTLLHLAEAIEGTIKEAQLHGLSKVEQMVMHYNSPYPEVAHVLYK